MGEKSMVLMAGVHTSICYQSGGLAGTFVDISLFPIDTLKTRLQSEHGFMRSGGFTQLYKGVTPVILGSAPTAALFFVTYENIKMLLNERVSSTYSPFIHMGSASIAESVSCFIRVPVEVIKQRKQALLSDQGRFNIKLLYRGYWSTILRDMPFSLIQFPLWEYFKQIWTKYVHRNVYPIEGAICGAFAGSIAAAITTPLDVVKTRIMLFNKNSYDSSKLSIFNVLFLIYESNGIKGLFAGILPRTTWITIGGFIFFGVYDKSKLLLLS
ncbi:PREDICTED: S-adenosylmethionine mitochondrial carrier protein homolog isoform X2 [Ceratosolen solmsi marchali]|uniref:S-adenosylmethionine mitochondrial carrier protein homolog isoform X2 n=1 Tax=Ceratosolen solmsi marchali TaxID=326594 RepID=A0AAJ6YS25_9HYME|nr:PREDICTED: S-adenosylmethionine mitochondrial carrier protein homolog isoform X2 [Ceratosolen solmsi marchali]